MLQDEARRLRERLAAAEGDVAEANDALRMAKEDAAAEQAENNAALAAASAELQELRDVHADVRPPEFAFLAHLSFSFGGIRLSPVCRLHVTSAILYQHIVQAAACIFRDEIQSVGSWYCKLHRTCPGKSKKLDVSCYERAVLVARQPKKEFLCLGMCDVICNNTHGLASFLQPLINCCSSKPAVTWCLMHNACCWSIGGFKRRSQLYCQPQVLAAQGLMSRSSAGQARQSFCKQQQTPAWI